MQPLYYMEAGGQKEGPLDLVTIMRRVRMRKILSDTPIYIDEAPAPVPAGEIPEIAAFFREDGGEAHTAPRSFSLTETILAGWRFTLEHNVMTVYAGGLLLISFLLATMLVNAFGLVRGGMAAWCLFVTLHNFYLLFTLRLYRGQTLGSDFVNHQLAPALGMLLLASVALALMMAGGFILLLIPGMAITVVYIFVPFLILDRGYNLPKAMRESHLLLFKHDRHHVSLIAALIILHLICLVLIIPIPLTLPVFAASLSRIYEELSASY
jgi:hypothetical protein